MGEFLNVADNRQVHNCFYLYILRELRKLVIVFFSVKNTPKLINQQLKNGVKIVNWKKKS